LRALENATSLLRMSIQLEVTEIKVNEENLSFEGNYKIEFKVTMSQLVERLTLRARLHKNGVTG